MTLVNFSGFSNGISTKTSVRSDLFSGPDRTSRRHFSSHEFIAAPHSSHLNAALHLCHLTYPSLTGILIERPSCPTEQRPCSPSRRLMELTYASSVYTFRYVLTLSYILENTASYESSPPSHTTVAHSKYSML